MGWECPDCKIAVDPGTSDTTKCAYPFARPFPPDGWRGPNPWHRSCNCAKYATMQLDGANWSMYGCQHCQDRRSQDYRCQAYQAKGMMNWSCKFGDRGKDAHFKGVYSKKLFCTDPRSLSPAPFTPYNNSFTATTDAELVITILCASCGKHGAHGDIFCRGCGAC